jgi:hypothetical protein
VEAEVGIGGGDGSGRTSEAEVMTAMEGTANAEVVDAAECQGTLVAYLPVTGQGRLNGCGSAKAG